MRTRLLALTLALSAFFGVGVIAQRVRVNGVGNITLGDIIATSLTSTGIILHPDGTSGAPAIAFTSEPTLGFWRSAAATITNQGSFTSTGLITANANVTVSSGGSYQFATRGAWRTPADGNFAASNSANTIGSVLKVDALPTVASGFGTSPSITAGSTPFAGSVNVGTGSPPAGVINFNGTAFPSAPFVVCTDDTTVLAVRCTATTTQLTLTPAVTFTASDVISWIAVSSK